MMKNMLKITLKKRSRKTLIGTAFTRGESLLKLILKVCFEACLKLAFYFYSFFSLVLYGKLEYQISFIKCNL